MSPKQRAHGSELHGYPIPRMPITFDLRQGPVAGKPRARICVGCVATDLVRLRVAVIVGMGGESPVRAAKVATSTIPIVFAVGGDPVDLGLLHNPGRPEANVTGVTFPQQR